MGTIPEDIERARAIYRSITTPWKRPRFPDPPSEFLPPEKRNFTRLCCFY